MIPIPKEDLMRMRGSSGLVESIVDVMREMHYDWETMRKMPLPTFMALRRHINEERKQMARELRR